MEKWYKEQIKTAQSLSKYVALSEDEVKEIDRVTSLYKMGISPHALKIIGREGKNSPLYKQCVPSINECTSSPLMQDDPLDEGSHCVTERLVHKYVDRGALFVSNMCFTYCRFCTRKNTIISTDGIISEKQLYDAVEYIKKTPQMRDVLITGGDPLTLPDEILEKIISSIHEIGHVDTIRIGTRAPVMQPSRITEKLGEMLKKYHPIWINTHFNHVSEITEESARACDILLSCGIPVGNQTVLLKGINDNYEAIESLVRGLIKIRVRPYYLYQCDYVAGLEHFITNYKIGADIIARLRGRVPGYAIPHFVIDLPQSGKIIVENSNIIEDLGECARLRGYDGSEVMYTAAKNVK